jgi:hypothetical protein
MRLDAVRVAFPTLWPPGQSGYVEAPMPYVVITKIAPEVLARRCAGCPHRPLVASLVTAAAPSAVRNLRA